MRALKERGGTALERVIDLRLSGFPSSGDESALNVKAALLSLFQEGWELLSCRLGLRHRQSSEIGKVV